MKKDDKEFKLIVETEPAESQANWIKYFPSEYVNRENRRFQMRNRIRTRTLRKKVRN